MTRTRNRRDRLRPSFALTLASATADRDALDERRAAERAAIVVAMRDARLPASLDDIAQRSGLSRARANRLLAAMTCDRIVRWVPRASGFPGFAFTEAGAPFIEGTSL